MTKKQLLVKAVAGISIAATTIMPLAAFATSSTVNLTMTGGTLSISAPATIALTGQTVSLYAQNTTGVNDDTTYAKFKVTDTRGTLAGWTLTGSSTALVQTGTALAVSGTAPLTHLGFSGSYNCAVLPGSSNGSSYYRVQITTGGAAGTAVYTWVGPDGTSHAGITSGAGGTDLLDSGVSVTFTGTTVLGETVSLPVGCASPLASQTVTPGGLVASSTASTGVTAGGGALQTAPRTLLSAEAGSGNGEYRIAGNWAFGILKNSMAGAHALTYTITII